MKVKFQYIPLIIGLSGCSACIFEEEEYVTFANSFSSEVTVEFDFIKQRNRENEIIETKNFVIQIPANKSVNIIVNRRETGDSMLPAPNFYCESSTTQRLTNDILLSEESLSQYSICWNSEDNFFEVREIGIDCIY